MNKKQLLTTLLEEVEQLDEIAHLETNTGKKIDINGFKLVFKEQVSTLIKKRIGEL